MGLFEVNVTVANPATPDRSRQVSLLVDTGATLSWLSRDLLESLDVQPVSRSRFILADGRRLERDMGIALFSLDGKTMGVPVAFGEAGEASVLGATGLEILGFGVDPVPVEKKLVPRDLMALQSNVSGRCRIPAK
jgi:predicted aspartyl protease